MNWEAIGAISEAVGVILIVASIVFLAIQIRHSTSVARSSVRHAVTEKAMAAAANLAESGKLTRLLRRSIDGEQLDPDERLRLHAWVYLTMRNWENIHYQYLSGLLSETEWGAFKKNLKLLMQAPPVQEYWDAEQEIYTDVFRTEIAGLLDEIQRQDLVSQRSVLMSQSVAEGLPQDGA